MAAARGVKTGVNSKVYRNTASGSSKYGTPTWTEVDHIKDATAPQPWDMVDASVRASRVKLYHPTQKDLAPTILVRCDDVDAGYLAFRQAAEEGTTLDLLIIDGPLTVEGSRGFRAFFHASETGQDQAIGNVLYSAFDLKPGFGVIDDGSPAYPRIAVVGASSAVTYTVPDGTGGA
jgi:hypothetical protein